MVRRRWRSIACPTTQALLDAPQPPTKTTADTLINDLAPPPHPSLPALDDCHLITYPAIRQAMKVLVWHLAPTLQQVRMNNEHAFNNLS